MLRPDLLRTLDVCMDPSQGDVKVGQDHPVSGSKSTAKLVQKPLNNVRRANAPSSILAQSLLLSPPCLFISIAARSPFVSTAENRALDSLRAKAIWLQLRFPHARCLETQ